MRMCVRPLGARPGQFLYGLALTVSLPEIRQVFATKLCHDVQKAVLQYLCNMICSQVMRCCTVEETPPEECKVCAPGEGNGNVTAGSHSAVDEYGILTADRLPHGGEQVERMRSSIELPSPVI